MTHLTEKTMHLQIIKLLPWYVNGTINADERKLITDHLQSCLSCRIELKYQQQFAHRIKHSSDIELMPKQSFSQLKARIQQSSEFRQQVPVSRHLVPQTKKTSEPFYLHWFERFQNLVLSPQMAVIVVGFCMLLLSIDHIIANRMNEFRTLAAQVIAEDASINDIRIVFKSAVDENQVSQFLSAFNATVVKEPKSPSKVYLIRIGQTGGQQRSIDQTINLMRQHQHIAFAERPYSALYNTPHKLDH